MLFIPHLLLTQCPLRAHNVSVSCLQRPTHLTSELQPINDGVFLGGGPEKEERDPFRAVVRGRTGDTH